MISQSLHRPLPTCFTQFSSTQSLNEKSLPSQSFRGRISRRTMKLQWDCGERAIGDFPCSGARLRLAVDMATKMKSNERFPKEYTVRSMLDAAVPLTTYGCEAQTRAAA